MLTSYLRLSANVGVLPEECYSVSLAEAGRYHNYCAKRHDATFSQFRQMISAALTFPSSTDQAALQFF